MAIINDTSNINNYPPILFDTYLSYTFQFWFSLVFHIPSIICYLFVLSYILIRKTQRKALHNHSIVILLLISFSIVSLDYSWTLDSYRRQGEVWPQTPFFCKIWWLIEFGFYDTCTIILAWSSFERHILIFHSNWLATKRRLILIHYLPLIIIPLYSILFYIYAILFPPCENEYDYTAPICGARPCYIDIPHLSIWSLMIHELILTVLIALFNIALLIRVLRQKHRHRQNWKKCRKMAFPLLSISALYLSINFPLMIINLVQSLGYVAWGFQAQHYLYFFTGFIQYLLPFICLSYLPGIWLKIKTFFMGNHRRITPVQTIPIIQNRQVQTKV